MLFLIPAYLSDESPIDFFAPVIKEYILKTDYFFVENEKTARKVIKFFCPEKKQPDLKLFKLDKYSAPVLFGLIEKSNCMGNALSINDCNITPMIKYFFIINFYFIF